MKALKGLFISVAPMLGSVGCATATSYGPRGPTGGYSDKQLNERSYHVEFNGNGYTSSSTTRHYALLRAAELTNQRGFYGFIVNGDKQDASYSTTPVICNKIGENTVCNGGYLVERPSNELTITMVTWEEAKALNKQGIVYDAILLITGKPTKPVVQPIVASSGGAKVVSAPKPAPAPTLQAVKSGNCDEIVERARYLHCVGKL